jgi:V/A-type H+-transporting ATPase subunit D
MADLIEGVNPTRMELLKLKTKVKLAKKGHRLLKEKRDALIMEFFNILEEAKGARRQAEARLREAFNALILAQASMGVLKVTQCAYAAKETLGIETYTRSIMGVRVPVLELQETSRSVIERGYGLADTTSQLDEAAARFEEALAAVVQLAEVERSIKLLAKEIESTKRRVNALENVLIPRLEATVKYIKMRLDEMERENFFKLKRIKAIMEAR